MTRYEPQQEQSRRGTKVASTQELQPIKKLTDAPARAKISEQSNIQLLFSHLVQIYRDYTYRLYKKLNELASCLFCEYHLRPRLK